MNPPARRQMGRVSVFGEYPRTDVAVPVGRIGVDAEHLVIRFLHDAGGAAWFGASLFANTVLLPFVMRQPVDRQRELVGGLLRAPERLIIVAALVAAVTGLVRGLWSGRIDSVDDLTTTWGATWLAAILVTLLVVAVGGRLTSPAMSALIRDDALWAIGATSTDKSQADDARAGTFGRLRVGFRLELLGLSVILALMVVLAAN